MTSRKSGLNHVTHFYTDDEMWHILKAAYAAGMESAFDVEQGNVSPSKWATNIMQRVHTPNSFIAAVLAPVRAKRKSATFPNQRKD